MDELIVNAVVYDGLSSEPQNVAVGIEGDRIVHVGERPTAAADKTHDADGLVLCPGFVDTHASTGYGYMLPNAGDNKLYQGVTSEIIGNCGTSPAPVGPLLVEEMKTMAEQIGFEYKWRGLGEWFDQVEEYGLPFNSGTWVGHSTLRSGVCEDPRNVGPEEVDEMARLLDQALEDGALGMATGLVYAPGSFASTEEIIDLAKIAAKRDGLYASHMRNEREGLEDSIDETIRISRESGAKALISHLKSAEKPNWGRVPAMIEKVEAARDEGVRITFEVYPYDAVSTKLSTFIPKPALADGPEALPEKLRSDEWRRRCADHLVERGTDFAAMKMITESLPGVRGKSIAEIAATCGQEPGDAVVDLLIADPLGWIVYHCISPDDLDAAVMWPESIICSDSWSYPVNAPNPIGDPHPRTYGAFSRFLERWALREERFSFGEAIRKVTSYPADWVGLPRRGRIAEGAYADLVLLDPSKVREKATFADPRQFSEGTEAVWVNGTCVLQGGELLAPTPLAGRVLRRRSEA